MLTKGPLPLCCVSEPTAGGPLRVVPLPNPEMSFHLWAEDTDVCEFKTRVVLFTQIIQAASWSL